MAFPKPIRFDADTWLCMRNDPVLPKAVIQRVHHAEGDKYLLFKWDTDPAKRMLMSVVDSLERANELVKYDPPPPNGVPPFQNPVRTVPSIPQPDPPGAAGRSASGRAGRSSAPS